MSGAISMPIYKAAYAKSHFQATDSVVVSSWDSQSGGTWFDPRQVLYTLAYHCRCSYFLAAANWYHFGWSQWICATYLTHLWDDKVCVWNECTQPTSHRLTWMHMRLSIHLIAAMIVLGFTSHAKVGNLEKTFSSNKNVASCEIRVNDLQKNKHV